MAECRTTLVMADQMGMVETTNQRCLHVIGTSYNLDAWDVKRIQVVNAKMKQPVNLCK